MRESNLTDLLNALDGIETGQWDDEVTRGSRAGSRRPRPRSPGLIRRAKQT